MNFFPKKKEKKSSSELKIILTPVGRGDNPFRGNIRNEN